MDGGGIMPRRIAPSTPRRTILKLLASSIAGVGLSGVRTDFVDAADAPAPVGDAAIGVELDASLHSRVLIRDGASSRPLTDFAPSETLRLADGRQLDRFRFVDQRSEPIDGRHGRGTRHVVRGVASDGIEKQISLGFHERYPGFALVNVTYRNAGAEAVRIGGWSNVAHVLKPDADGALDYWSFCGASYIDRRDC
jgi:alpha-galactosidase